MSNKTIAGRLRVHIAFDMPESNPDGSGGVEVGWVEFRTCRAEFIYSRGSEVVDAARLQGHSVYKVKIRNLGTASQIDQSCRMRTVQRGLPDGEGLSDPLPGERYNVQEVDRITMRGWVYLVVESGVAN